jgi:hypothetical protein
MILLYYKINSSLNGLFLKFSSVFLSADRDRATPCVVKRRNVFSDLYEYVRNERSVTEWRDLYPSPTEIEAEA